MKEVEHSNLLQKISTAYSEPGRLYHNLTHIEELLRLYEEYSHLLAQQEAVFLAIVFHDIIYDTHRKDNEELSAQFALSHLKPSTFTPGVVGRACELIRATASHRPMSQEFDSLWFLDADLSILGAEPDQYRAYALAIRKEFSWVEENEYRAGRSAVLQKFLKRKQLYFTAEFKDKLEKQARANINNELAHLTDKSGS